MLLYGTMGHYSVRNSNKQQGWPNNVRRREDYTITTYYSYIERELQRFIKAKCATSSNNDGWPTLSILLWFIEVGHALMEHVKVYQIH